MALFINGVGQDTFNMNGVSIDNLYVDDVLVWTSIVPEATIPRYELTEVLVDPSTVDDSANTLPDFNGLLTESDGTTPYEPTALQYPGNGLLELDNGRIMDTQYAKGERVAAYGIYDADGSSVYKIWAIEWDFNDYYDIWEGDQDTPISLTQYAHQILETVESWKVTDGRPSWLPSLDPTYGPELVDGGGNDNGIVATSFWAEVGTIGDGTLGTSTTDSRLCLRFDPYNQYAGIYQAFNTEIGETYEVNADLIGSGASNIYVGIDHQVPTESASDVSSSEIGPNVTWESITPMDFVATATTTYVSLRAGSITSSGDFIRSALISVKKRT